MNKQDKELCLRTIHFLMGYAQSLGDQGKVGVYQMQVELETLSEIIRRQDETRQELADRLAKDCGFKVDVKEPREVIKTGADVMREIMNNSNRPVHYEMQRETTPDQDALNILKTVTKEQEDVMGEKVRGLLLKKKLYPKENDFNESDL